MDRLSGPGHATEGGFGARPPQSALEIRGVGRRHADERDRLERAIDVAEQDAELGRADAHRVFQHGLEHGLELAGGARDHAQHLGGRGLLLQRLGELARSRLLGLEQPHVLDRDHRLVGEGRDQLDLLVGERPHRGPRQRDYPNRFSFTQKRHAEKSAVAAAGLVFGGNVFRICQDIQNMNRSAFQCRSSGNRSTAWRNRVLRNPLLKFTREAMPSGDTEDFAVT